MPTNVRTLFQGLGDVHYIPDTLTPADLEALSLATDIGGAGAQSILGVEGGECIFDQSGWDPSESDVNTPDWASLAISTIQGPTTWGRAAFRYYWVGATHPIYTLLVAAINANAYIVRAPDGVSLAADYDVYPARIASCRRDHNVDGNAQAFTLGLALSEPTPGIFAA
jgi:hypothetical protein